ncbi:NAD(P)/FAD-dependent oxidoreductase, partial [Streptomyces boluensis]
MGPKRVDFMVVGDGVLGRSIAYALASAEPTARVALSGRRGEQSEQGAASGAAGAMLSTVGEVTAATSRTVHGRLRLSMAVQAADRWPRWRDEIRAYAGAGAPVDDGYGTGTFILLNAVSARLDEQAFHAIEAAARRHALPVEHTDPADIPGYRPLDNDRALRALHLPAEAFLDARRWLATLDAALHALPNLARTPAGLLRAAGDDYTLHTGADRYTAPTVIVAAGAWTTPLLARLDPDLTVLPVVCAEGSAVSVDGPTPLRSVLRTPNRAYACGLHAVPQADGAWYVGATAQPAISPGERPTLGGVRFLLDAALGQLHHGLTGSALRQLHHGNRPIGLDGHPLLGQTARPGLWVATGTHRDGLHASPLIAQELSEALLHGTPSHILAAWRPDRALINDWTAAEAGREAASHHHALTAESRMRPPLTGSWPDALATAYRHQLDEAYAAMPDGYVPPPELAPLAYEHGPA